MKSNPKKGKLSLNKRAVAKLDDAKLKNIAAGQDAEAQPEFTSIFHCSKGGLTCNDCGTFLCTFTQSCPVNL